MITFTPNIDRNGFRLVSDQPITLVVHHNLEGVSDPDQVTAFLYKGTSATAREVPSATYDSHASDNEGLLDGNGKPLEADLWDQVPGPEIEADYIPALDGTAAVRGPSDAHPELALSTDDASRSLDQALDGAPGLQKVGPGVYRDETPDVPFEQNHALDDPRQDWFREQDELLERIDALRGNHEFIRRIQERIEADQVILRRLKGND
jgi:hypothetical protein